MTYYLAQLTKEYDTQHSCPVSPDCALDLGNVTPFQLSKTGARFIARNVEYSPAGVLFPQGGLCT
jgi:hypothetical protein